MQPIPEKAKINITLNQIAFRRFLNFKLSRVNPLLNNMLSDLSCSDISKIEITNDNFSVQFQLSTEEHPRIKHVEENSKLNEDIKKLTSVNINTIDDMLELVTKEPSKKITPREFAELNQKAEEIIERCELKPFSNELVQGEIESPNLSVNLETKKRSKNASNRKRK